MKKQNLKIQMLAGNPVNSWFSAGSQISSTLVGKFKVTYEFWLFDFLLNFLTHKIKEQEFQKKIYVILYPIFIHTLVLSSFRLMSSILNFEDLETDY